MLLSRAEGWSDWDSSPISISTIWRNINPLKPELNPICYLLALLGAHHFLHFSRIRVKLLTFRRLMSYIYGAPILDVSRSHTTTQHSRWDSSGRVICSSQRPLPDITQHTQQKIIHAPGGIRIHNLNRRAVADLRLRSRGIWDSHLQRLKMLQLSFRTTTHVEMNSGFGEIILFFIIRYLLVISRSYVLIWYIFLFWTGECNTIIESHFHPCIRVK